MRPSSMASLPSVSSVSAFLFAQYSFPRINAPYLAIVPNDSPTSKSGLNRVLIVDM